MILVILRSVQLSLGAQLVLEHLLGAEPLELQIELRGLRQRRRGHQADDLALEHADAVARGFALDRLRRRGRSASSRSWSGSSTPARCRDPARAMPIALTKRKPPLLMRMRAGDLLRDIEPIGGEIDVVGDERHARADDRRAGGRMRLRRAEVRRSIRAAASSRRAPRTRRGGCPRDCGAPAVAAASSYRKTGSWNRVATSAPTSRASATHLHRHAFDRDERADVDGAEARVLALVRAQIDRRERLLVQRAAPPA